MSENIFFNSEKSFALLTLVTLEDISVLGHTPIDFASDDFIELLNIKSSKSGDFFRRFRIAPNKP